MSQVLQFKPVSAFKKQALPKKRRFSNTHLPRPRKRNAGKRWAFRGATLLEESSATKMRGPASADRKTNADLTETELLHALNYLDADGLQSFPGIGEFLANKILQHRHQVDYFEGLEELLEVRLFGAKRFENLVGREPVRKKITLHQLMRVGRDASKPITVDDFYPWRRPAPGIEAIWLIPAFQYYRDQSVFAQSPNVIVHAVGSYRIVFLCDDTEPKGRSNYLIRKLPKLIRSINYERSFTTTN